MRKKNHKSNTIPRNIFRPIIALLIGLIVTGSTFGLSHRTTYALDGGGSLALFAKEMADAIAWIFGDMMIAAISGQTYEWATEGFGSVTVEIDPNSLEPIRRFSEGDMTFLTNPSQFFSDIGDEITSYFIGELQLIADSSVEGLTEGLAQISARANEGAISRLTTTLDETQLREFVGGDFLSQGGWETWLELANNPQNYFDGAMHIALSELETLKSAAIQRNRDELMHSGGFLTIRQCQQSVSDFDGELRRYASAKADETGCLSYTNVTPGGIVGDKVKSAISADLDRIAAADEITEIIASLITTIINQLVQQGFSEITNVTQSFGTPSAVERDGVEKVEQLRGDTLKDSYVPGMDGPNDQPPPPENPDDETS